jgi:hypothetical protein
MESSLAGMERNEEWSQILRCNIVIQQDVTPLMRLEAYSWESELAGSDGFTMTSEYRAFFKELFEYFKKSQIVRTAVMNHFRTYLLDNDQRIEKDTRKTTEKNKVK